jgi:hypothetical protein
MNRVIIFFLTLLIVFAIIEISLLIFFYINADEVRCNFIFCEFITQRTTVESRTSVSQECYINGVRTDCK